MDPAVRKLLANAYLWDLTPAPHCQPTARSEQASMLSSAYFFHVARGPDLIDLFIAKYCGEMPDRARESKAMSGTELPPMGILGLFAGSGGTPAIHDLDRSRCTP
jgi:hypothetical protein